MNEHLLGPQLRDEKLNPYPDRLEAENAIRNGTFDWSKSPTSVLFLKKHKCARNRVYMVNYCILLYTLIDVKFFKRNKVPQRQ